MTGPSKRTLKNAGGSGSARRDLTVSRSARRLKIHEKGFIRLGSKYHGQTSRRRTRA